jgi:hypothetical protein
MPKVGSPFRARYPVASKPLRHQRGGVVDLELLIHVVGAETRIQRERIQERARYCRAVDQLPKGPFLCHVSRKSIERLLFFCIF